MGWGPDAHSRCRGKSSALIKKVPRGRLVTINELRTALAKKHRADFACPITTGIFAWMAAHAPAEDEAAGGKRITLSGARSRTAAN